MGRYEGEKNAGLIQTWEGASCVQDRRRKQNPDELMKGIRKAPPTHCPPMMAGASQGATMRKVAVIGQDRVNSVENTTQSVCGTA